MKYAVIKVRGEIKASPGIRNTLQSLGLESKYDIKFLEDSSSVEGMLRKVESFVVYGKVDEDFMEQHGFEQGETYSLSPPSGGLNTTKKNYSNGGSTGKNPDIEMIIGEMA